MGNADKQSHLVLVGTYRTSQLDKWILPNGLYNYPVGADEDIAVCAQKISELWLYAENKAKRAFKAEFVGVKSREQLENDYAYPKSTSKAHSGSYLLFKIEELEKPTSVYSRTLDVKVIVRVKDFAKRLPKVAKELKAQFENPKHEPQSVQTKYLIDELYAIPKTHLCVCEEAIQLDFFEKIFQVKISHLAIGFRGSVNNQHEVRFVDLFSGIGGIRTGFEQACSDYGLASTCVFTSEIKPHAVEIHRQNHPEEFVHGDITQICEDTLPDFDFLLAGFPCQAFSAAGKRLGFQDTRGTLFFDVERILKTKKPFGFVLENVEGLVNHDKADSKDSMGRTLTTILSHLEDLGYKISWRVLNAKNFGVPQKRKRIYIVGTRIDTPNLDDFPVEQNPVSAVLETGLPLRESKFVKKLLSHYSPSDLVGRAIKDKRGGKNNIHSWDIEFKGEVNEVQRNLLNQMLKERRKKKWAEEYGIDWMDGMPLTLNQIQTFFSHDSLEALLEDLVAKRYLVKEYPKQKNGSTRVQDPTLPLGYNIVTGKMSFEVNSILDPSGVAPTLVAMDMQNIFVVDGDGIRPLSMREGLRLFGYPEDFKFDISTDLGRDLLGNTVVVPVIRAVSQRVLDVYTRSQNNE